MKRWQWIGLGVLAILFVGGIGYGGYRSAQARRPAVVDTPPTVPVARGDVQQVVSAPGQMVETRHQTLHMGVEGQLDEVLVHAGDAVKEGQVLARLAGKETFEAKVAAARLDLLQAQQELNDLVANAPKQSADAQIALMEAQKKLEKAQATVDAMKYPRAGQDRIDSVYNDYQQALQDVALAQNAFDDVVSLADYDARRIAAVNVLTEAQTRRDRNLATYNWLTGKPTEADVAKAQAELKQAQAEADVASRAWKRVEDGPDETQMELAKAKIADLEAKYASAQSDLDHLELKAPFKGVVTEVKANPGDLVTVATAILELTDPQALEAEVTVVEEDWALIKPGQTATLYLDASTEGGITGTVERIIPSRTSGDRPVYPAYILPKSALTGVAPGMTVDASIVIDSRKDVLVLPKAVVRMRGDGTAEIEVWKNGAREKRQIRLGLVGDQNVEILEGLQEGDLVVGQ